DYFFTNVINEIVLPAGISAIFLLNRTESHPARSPAAAGSVSALFGERGGRRSHAPHLDDGLLVLGAVVMDLARVMDDIASGGHRHGAVRIELLAGPHPPGTGQYDEEAVVRMKVRPAHVTRQPFEAHDVGARLAGVAEQHGLLVRSGGVPDPFDVEGGFKIHRAAVDLAGVARWRCYYHAENGKGKHSSQSGHVASFWLGLPLLSEIRGNDARAKTVRTQRMFLFPLAGSLRRWVKS